MAELIDISGNEFEHCRALKHVGGGKGGAKFLFRCECGKEFIARSNDVRKGRIKSCGCVNRREIREKTKKHGFHKHPIYQAWSHIKQRCHNPKNKEYKNYGGRGIVMCNDWFDNPEEFINWSLKNGWRKGLTIDRIDNEKGYCPDNCRWVSMEVQENNKRNNHYYDYNGEKKTLSQIARENGISRNSLYYRANVKNIPLEKAVEILKVEKK